VNDETSSHRSHKVKRKNVNITENLQNLLWNQTLSVNEKCIPRKLSLCINMPIIIRNNAATELCITRGQEALVHCWQSTTSSRGQKILDTLFVKLVNPLQNVQFDGLPLNIVPLTKTSATLRCSLPDDSSLTINCSQVEILPNFAMTDYSSQSKTRPQNPVDLNNCRTHQSYYTALS
jgi:hypothetical protein